MEDPYHRVTSPLSDALETTALMLSMNEAVA
jgi:hypothetical protein